MSLSLNDVVLCSALRMFFKVHVKVHLFYQHFLSSDIYWLLSSCTKNHSTFHIIKVPAKQIDIWYIATIVSRCWPIFHFIGKHLLLLLFKWILFDMWLLQKDFQIYRHSFGHGSQTYVDKFSSSRQAYAKAHTTSLWPQLTISSNIRKICWSDRL